MPGVSATRICSRARVKEADRSYQTGQTFFQHVMTVSNHRPFTYPAGRIQPPHAKAAPSLADRTLSKYVEQTREGGVRYTDFAIGKFIEQARCKAVVQGHAVRHSGRSHRVVGRQDRGRSGRLSHPGNVLCAGFHRASPYRSPGQPDRYRSQHSRCAASQLSQSLRRSGPDFGGGARPRLHLELPEGGTGTRRQRRVAGTPSRCGRAFMPAMPSRRLRSTKSS